MTDETVRTAERTVARVNAKYAGPEQIKKFTLLGRDLRHEDGELTPTPKVKGNVIDERYAGELDGMYA